MDELNDNERAFLHSVSHHTDIDRERDDDDEPPRFPVISTCIITGLFVICLSVVSYMMSYASRYQVLFQDDKTRNIIQSTDSLSALSMTSSIYDNRIWIYALFVIMFILIEGTIMMIHWYHVSRWDRNNSEEGTYEQDNEEDQYDEEEQQ